MKRIKHVNPNYDITVKWVPSHEGVHGNEEVDKAAKMAAEGQHHTSPCALLPCFLCNGSLPLSLSALRQAHHAQTHARWADLWPTSP
ncbi:hypothetical protein BDR04DRAFT_1007493 [Suillus decipiens]|nr:hypothetical protein BDR04DRAFT_1007493 [Suillus decipiens]